MTNPHPRLLYVEDELRKCLRRLRSLPFEHLIRHFCPLDGIQLGCKYPYFSDISFQELINMHIPPGKVYQFIRRIFLACLRQNLFGNRSNMRVLCHRIKQFLCANRFDKFSLHNCIQGIRVNHISWLKIGRQCRRTERCTPEESKRRVWILASIVEWLFDRLVIDVARHNFYVTDTAMNKNKLFFYRMDIWDEISRRAFTCLSESLLTRLSRVEAEETLEKRTLGYSRIRFLPKEDGVRPIVNLKRKVKGSWPTKVSHPHESQPSVNSLLQNAFHVLSMESTRSPEFVGFSVTNNADIFQRLRTLRRAIRPTRQTLFFAKVDIQKSFDMIQQDILLQLVESIVTDKNYIVRRFASVYSVFGKIARNFKRKASLISEFCDFSSYADMLIKTMKNVILVDQVVCTGEDSESLLKLIREHISQNVVRYGNAFFRQRMGITQGSILSPLLCNLFYGSLEMALLGDLSKRENTFIIRFLDDFLCVSSDQDTVRDFINIMYQGNPMTNIS
jgi:telomerase reverse transcriptase